jgi:lipase chaperone LimK
VKVHRLKLHMKPSCSSSKVTIIAAGAFLASGLIYAFWPAHSQPEQHALPATSPAPYFGTLAANPFGRGEAATVEPAASPSLPPPAARGNGIFRIDEKGELVLDGETQSRLNVFVSNLPGNAAHHDLQVIEAHALDGLPKPSLTKAQAVLQNYLRYIGAEKELNAMTAAVPATSPEEILDRLIELRRQYLGTQVADALFGSQERQERLGVQLAMLDAAPNLAAKDKLARLDALQAAAPDAGEDMRSELDAARASLLVEQQASMLRERGASEAEMRQFREQQFGKAGTESFDEMETHKQEWERRSQAFLQQKNALAQLPIGAQQKQDGIEALLSQFYSAEEIPVARSIHGLPARN